MGITQSSEVNSSENLAALVERVRTGDSSAVEELYGALRDGIGFLVARGLGRQDADDQVHDVFLIVLQAIRQNRLQQPAQLLAYTRTVAKRQIASEIRRCIKRRERESSIEISEIRAKGTPEQYALERERTDIMKRVLIELSPKYREILTRFYVHAESEQQISKEMGLTATQFRLLKWRAKARFTALAQRSFNSSVPKLPADPPRLAVR